MTTAVRRDAAEDPVAAYKRMLAAILERRPSGTRQRLATALAKNRSFVSQIANPAYATPIPAAHLDIIFEVCHFSGPERREFLQLYGVAHPNRVSPTATASTRAVDLPDLGDPSRNARLHAIVSNFVNQLAELLDDHKGRGKRQ